MPLQIEEKKTKKRMRGRWPKQKKRYTITLVKKCQKRIEKVHHKAHYLRTTTNLGHDPKLPQPLPFFAKGKTAMTAALGGVAFFSDFLSLASFSRQYLPLINYSSRLARF
jgi:hypothetical protein